LSEQAERRHPIDDANDNTFECFEFVVVVVVVVVARLEPCFKIRNLEV